MTWTVTIDNGSTFTDGCLFADGKATTVKVLTTPYDLMRCFTDIFRSLAKEAGLKDEADLLRRVEEVRYSTTAGTNALLIRKGVRVGIICGADGADSLCGLKHSNQDLFETLVADRVVGIAAADVTAEDQEHFDTIIIRSIRELLSKGTQWIVVSFPEPWGSSAEQLFKQRYMKLFPGHLLGSVPFLFSRDLCLDPDDARRTATALLNSFLHRETARFLYHADGWVREHHVRQPLRIMRNDGGCGRVAKTSAVKTLDSGPMGGLAGSAALARLSRLDQIVSMDVGGTSTDIGLVAKQQPLTDLFGSVHGLPFSFSFPALSTSALGGGSLFQVQDGTIRIGPESAGALPGPVCFGRGGKQPTLTDAALLVGYLDAKRFAGGSIDLQADASARAIQNQISEPLGLSDARAGAWAMIQAFADALTQSVTAVFKSKGWDAAQTTLLAFGGCGPLLAGMVAERVGVAELIIPPASESFSALGVGFARLAHEYRSLFQGPVSQEQWQETVTNFQARANRDMFGEGVAQTACQVSVQLRRENDATAYVASPGALPKIFQNNQTGQDTRTVQTILDYQYIHDGSGQQQFPTQASAQEDARQLHQLQPARQSETRTIVMDGESQPVPVISVEALADAQTGSGPCLLETGYWSTLVLPGWSWTQTECGLRIRRV